MNRSQLPKWGLMVEINGFTSMAMRLREYGCNGGCNGLRECGYKIASVVNRLHDSSHEFLWLQMLSLWRLMSYSWSGSLNTSCVWWLMSHSWIKDSWATHDPNHSWVKGSWATHELATKLFLQSTVHTYDLLACLARDIRLKPSSKGLIHNAPTVCCICQCWGLTSRMMVKHIQGSNEELMCILLLISSKMAGVSPHQMKQFEWNVGRVGAWVELHSQGRQHGTRHWH